jgi:signal transduction histidine kinase
VKAKPQSAVPADAATVLSQQLLEQIRRIGELLAPVRQRLDREYIRKIKDLGHAPDRRDLLGTITPGAAAAHLAGGGTLATFLEQVEYSGRRLAKLGLAPPEIVAALRQFDSILDAVVAEHLPDEAQTVTWVRNQLHFLVILTLNHAFYQVREAESQAFYDLFRVEVESRSLDEMLRRFLDVLLRFTGADAGRVHIAGAPGDGWTLAASVPPGEAGSTVAVPPRRLQVLTEPRCLGGTSADILDPAWRGLYQTVWSVPLKSEGSLGGVMQFGFRQSFAWLPRETELLAAAAERCWLAAEKARLMEDLAQREEQVRRLAEHMVEVEESERRRISRELHDEAGQSLLCIRLQLEMIEQELPPEAAPLRQRLVETRQTTEHTILEIRRLIAALSPSVLEQMGLAAALRQLVARFRRLHPAEVRLQLPRRIELPKKVEIIVYRLVQEIFNNISKYSLASTVNLSLGSADGILRMSVEDDGVGFNVEEALSRRDCFGLSGLRERVALLGGTLVVQSRMRAAGQIPASGRKTKNERPRGEIGVDRPGTAIRIELPVPVPAQGPRKRSRSAR